MKKHQISRRGVLKGSLMASVIGGTGSFFGPWKENAWAQGAAKPIKLGLTCDASGQYGNSGQDDMRGIVMAIDEVNAKGGVLGRKVTWVTADTETTPATGSRIAERFITREDCTILIGAVHSGVANAITQVAAKNGVIYLNTNSSAPSEAGENCSRIKFVWDGNGTNFSKASVKNAVNSIGKNWMLLTNDYVWGHTTSAATKAQVEGSGGKIMDNLLVPQNTRDFTAYLLKIQQAKPDVVATAIGGDDIKALREQVAQLKLDGKPAWINNQQDWPDVWGAPEQPVRRVRHHLVSQAAAARRRGFREEMAGHQQGRLDPGTRQRVLQRLHGDARIAESNRTRGFDQQRQDHQGARKPEGLGHRPDAAF